MGPYTGHRTVRQGATGNKPFMETDSDGIARQSRPLLLVPVQAALMVGLGLLVTGPLAGLEPLSREDAVNRALAARRTPLWDSVTEWLSTAAGTPGIVLVTLVCVIALVVLPRAPLWREAVFLGGSVAVQSAVFLCVTVFVDRDRPEVHHLDAAPPTSSFPSGHVGASVALYGGLATLLMTRTRGARRPMAAGVLLLIPLAVGVSRMYRGMHHPSDVVGGLVNGVATLLVVGHALLTADEPGGDPGRASLPAQRGPGDATAEDPAVPGGGRRAAVIRHPKGCGNELAGRVRDILDRHGYADQRWTDTSAEHPGGGPAARTAAADADVVVVCGGDGTVRACAEFLAGTEAAMAIVPCGTGNLLARNLGLPMDPVTALERALEGTSAGIDVGRVTGDGLPESRFAVMAGAGFDAAMVRDTSERLKARLGWAAYVIAAVRHLPDARMRLSIRLDDGPVLERRARMVVVGNVGTLQGGLPLLPDARPDSGRLDVVLLDPRGAGGWLATAGHFGTRMLPGRSPGAALPAGGQRRAGGALEYFTAERIDLRFSQPQPRELDGDSVGDGVALTIEVEPGALRALLPGRTRPAVRTPAPEEDSSATAAG